MPDFPEKSSPRTGSGTETLNWGHWTGADAAARPTILCGLERTLREVLTLMIVSIILQVLSSL